MVDFCCVKGSSALKNTTNTSGCLASLHLGFKLSQDVFSDCFSCLYQLFSGCTRQQHTNVAKFGGTAQTLQFHGLNSQFYRDASGQLFLRRVLFTGSVDKVKKKKKNHPRVFAFFPCDLCALFAAEVWVVLQSRVHLHSESRFGDH